MNWMMAILCLSFTVRVGATDPDARRAERMRQREALHQRMFQALQSNNIEQSMREMEQMMNQLMSDVQTDMQEFSFSGTSTPTVPFTYDWLMNNSGRSLVITPAAKDTKLDVKVENQLLTIAAAVQGGQTKRVMSVPPDCDPDRVKMEQKNGKLVLFFPFKPQDSGLKPLPGAKDDIQT